MCENAGWPGLRAGWCSRSRLVHFISASSRELEQCGANLDNVSLATICYFN